MPKPQVIRQATAANPPLHIERGLKRVGLREALKRLPALHEAAVGRVDCLACACCCKGYSPRFKGPDIKRAAAYLGMKEMDFRQAYMRTDEDGDYVARSQPCPMLQPDNTCQIYEARPSDCARFPLY